MNKSISKREKAQESLELETRAGYFCKPFCKNYIGG